MSRCTNAQSAAYRAVAVPTHMITVRASGTITGSIRQSM